MPAQQPHKQANPTAPTTPTAPTATSTSSSSAPPFPFVPGILQSLSTLWTGITTNLTNGFDAFGTMFGWLATPTRLLKMILGLLLIGTSIFLMTAENPDVQQLAKTAVKTAVAA